MKHNLPNISSYRDGKEIKLSSSEDRVTIVRTLADRGCYELVIADVQTQDAGRYSCRAINEYGDVTSEALVTVVGKLSMPFYRQFIVVGTLP